MGSPFPDATVAATRCDLARMDDLSLLTFATEVARECCDWSNCDTCPAIVEEARAEWQRRYPWNGLCPVEAPEEERCGSRP
jgi:hypothetical protein